MEITYLAKRFRDGDFYCYDVVADGTYLQLFLPNGSPTAVIEDAAQEYLDDPFPDTRQSDSVTVEEGDLETPAPEAAEIQVIPDGYSDTVLWLNELDTDVWLLQGLKELLG